MCWVDPTQQIILKSEKTFNLKEAQYGNAKF